MQTKHDTESAAREAARKLGKTHVTIIESRDAYYVETDAGIIRSFERVAYEGEGRKA